MNTIEKLDRAIDRADDISRYNMSDDEVAITTELRSLLWEIKSEVERMNSICSKSLQDLHSDGS